VQLTAFLCNVFSKIMTLKVIKISWHTHDFNLKYQPRWKHLIKWKREEREKKRKKDRTEEKGGREGGTDGEGEEKEKERTKRKEREGGREGE